METPYRIEPTKLSSISPEIANAIADVVAAAVRLERALHSDTAASLADLVRIMNCYYSNLIEGHNTRPKEIEQALAAQNDELRGRYLQLEARAHVRVQQEIDRRHSGGELGEPTSIGFITWLHEEFYSDAPDVLLTVGEGERAYKMIPGKFRERPEQDVMVGRHQPPSSDSVVAFMNYFAERFGTKGSGTAEAIVAMPIAHHRLNYIHPFPDGNGRVSRLMSHAMALRAGVGTHGLWSVSRGLARGLRDRGEYKSMMDDADSPRRGDLDGRGNLSEAALHDFVLWFLRVCLDQITFMGRLFDLSTLDQRLQELTTRRGLRRESGMLLGEVLRRGSLPRGGAPTVMGLPERTAREALSKLIEAGLLVSKTPKSAVTLRFTSETAAELFPNLYPAEAVT